MWMSYMKNKTKKKHVRRRRVSDKQNYLVIYIKSYKLYLFISLMPSLAYIQHCNISLIIFYQSIDVIKFYINFYFIFLNVIINSKDCLRSFYHYFVQVDFKILRKLKKMQYLYNITIIYYVVLNRLMQNLIICFNFLLYDKLICKYFK